MLRAACSGPERSGCGWRTRHPAQPRDYRRDDVRAPGCAPRSPVERFLAEHGENPPTTRELSDDHRQALPAPRTTAVAGYDLTFSPVKSVSHVVGGRPDPGRSRDREGARCERWSTRWLSSSATCCSPGRGATAPGRSTSRVGSSGRHSRTATPGPDDPDLHTHVAVANKVQTGSGKWLSRQGPARARRRRVGDLQHRPGAAPGRDARSHVRRAARGVDRLNHRKSQAARARDRGRLGGTV
jgi:hypothetical protein